MVEFKCLKCGSDIKTDGFGGETTECPSCKKNVIIPMPEIIEGMKLGEFIVSRRLGAGGMGEVWLAEQPSMDRKIALKILSPALMSDKSFVDRFMAEVKLSAKLEHSNIVSAYSAGHEKGVRFLAMSFVDGCELETKLRIDKVMKEQEALKIVRDLADALKYAWNKFKIIHRDIKPANIMLDEDGYPKLMDMGISKSLSDDSSLTMTGTVMGSPHYISPEQGRAEKTIDFRADLYSLGITLYQMVTGELPYNADTTMGVLSKHLMDDFPPPQDKNKDVSKYCSALLKIMMQKKPEERQPSWEALIEDIDFVLQGKFPKKNRGKQPILIPKKTVAPVLDAGTQKMTPLAAPTNNSQLFNDTPVKAQSTTLLLKKVENKKQEDDEIFETEHKTTVMQTQMMKTKQEKEDKNSLIPVNIIVQIFAMMFFAFIWGLAFYSTTSNRCFSKFPVFGIMPYGIFVAGFLSTLFIKVINYNMSSFHFILVPVATLFAWKIHLFAEKGGLAILCNIIAGCCLGLVMGLAGNRNKFLDWNIIEKIAKSWAIPSGLGWIMIFFFGKIVLKSSLSTPTIILWTGIITGIAGGWTLVEYLKDK